MRPRLYFSESQNKLMMVEGDGNASYLFLTQLVPTAPPIDWVFAISRREDSFKNICSDLRRMNYEFIGYV